MDRVKPTMVIHCAAVVPKSSADYEDGVAAWASLAMTTWLSKYATCPLVFASSLTAADTQSTYAEGKRCAEFVLKVADVTMRLPGLFGLPRQSGVIYQAARAGAIPDSFGPYPAMHVADAAEYLVRAATMPSDGSSEPFNVVYGDARLEACYGSLGVTFDQRVQELVETLKAEQACTRL